MPSRPLRLLLSLACLLLALTAPALADELVSNGSFETGLLAPWLTSIEGPTGWYATDDANAPLSGNLLHAPYEGSWQAVADQEAPGRQILYQHITIPAAHDVWLSMFYWVHNHAADYISPSDLSTAHDNQQVRIDIMDPAAAPDAMGAAVWRNLLTTIPGTALEFSGRVNWPIGEFAGQTIRLRIAVVSTEDYLNVGVDAVTCWTQPLEEVTVGIPGATRASAAWGDFDNDEDMDLVFSGVTNQVPFNVTCDVFRNFGPDFTAVGAGFPAVYGGPRKWGDFDGDGDLDLVVSGYALVVGPTVTRIYRNTGGVFADIGAGLPGLYGGDAAWGDCDNDGDLDLAIFGDNGSGPFTEIYRNTAGAFTAMGAGLPGIRFGAVAWGDVDGDGDLDLLLSGWTTGDVELTRVYRNDGGTFTDSGISLPQLRSTGAAWADYDNDGDLDLALNGRLADLTPITRVYRNDGGSLTDIAAGLPGTWSGEVAWGDYDGDGDPDLAVAGNDGATPVTRVFENTGSGFEDIGADLYGIEDGTIAWADWDGDMKLDLLVTGENSPTSYITRIYRNVVPQGVHAPTAPGGLAAIAPDWSHLTLNWSAATDVETPSAGLSYNLRVGSSSGSNNVMPGMAVTADGYRLLPALGNAQKRTSWTVSVPGPGTYYWSAQAIDATHEAGPYATQSSITVTAFTESGSGLGGAFGGDGIWGDYDSDHDLDLLVLGDDGTGTPRTRLYANVDGVFTENLYAGLPGLRDAAAAWGDMEGDGDLDLFLAGHDGARRVAAWYRNSYGGFAEWATATGVDNCDAAWGDYDNDGDLDLLYAGDQGAGYLTRLMRNDGGTFTDSGVALLGLADASVDWGDYDKDGDMDFVISGTAFLAAVCRVYRNDGGGVFTDIAAGLPGLSQGSARWGDYDQDGDLDLALCGSNLARIYRNDAGAFTNIGASLVQVGQGSLAWGDYDNDGDLDLMIQGVDFLGVDRGGLYRNTAGSFAFLSLSGLTAARQGSVAWGDADNDGDLDLLLTGVHGTTVMTSLYRNNCPVANTIPAAPTGLSAALVGSTVRFSWTAATDAETPPANLTYNLRIGIVPGRGEIMPSQSLNSWSDGYRRVVQFGNVSHGLSWSLPISALPDDGPMYMSVQAVDAAFAGSPWSTNGANKYTLTPTILSVEDIPGDEGNMVTMEIDASPLDFAGSMTLYEIWRRNIEEPAASPASAAAGVKPPEAAPSFPPGDWTLVSSFPPTQQGAYSLNLGTQEDSTCVGSPWPAWVVVARTADPDVWFMSPPDSGYSLNNTVPGMPTGMAADYEANAVDLSWDPAPETDFAQFHVYRGTDPSFVPAPENRIAMTVDPQWRDEIPNAALYSYKVTTVDTGCIESVPASPGEVTDAPAGPVLPTSFALHPGAPNPFAASTTIGFDLPRESAVRVEVFTVAGRRVRVLAEGSLPAGSHRLRWDGRDQGGQPVATGAYFCRLRTEGFEQTTRLMVIR